MKLLFVFSILSFLPLFLAEVPPLYQVFPAPQSVPFVGTDSVQISPDFKLEISHQDCSECVSLIQSAFDRAILKTMQAHQGLAPWRVSNHPQIAPNFVPHFATPALGKLDSLTVTIPHMKEPEPLELGFNESYVLSITATAATLESPSVWGVIRGMETLAQLFDWDGHSFYVNKAPLTISDFPRFKWRGLMIDTARHYLSLPTIKRILDAMSVFKLNTLHWHMVDAQSFPWVSTAYPELSKKGAFSPDAVFTKDAITQIVAYARERGIIVIPELDFPGHTASWGLGYPGVTVDCWDYIGQDKLFYAENIVGLNPANQLAHDMIKGLLSELASIFPSKFVHIGGDEVNTRCWNASTQHNDIHAYMQTHNMTSYAEVQSHMAKTAQQHLFETANRRSIVWEEALDLPLAPVLPTTVVQVWRGADMLKRAVSAGYQTVLSLGYYQDTQAPLCTEMSAAQPECAVDRRYWLWIWTWLDMYNNDPIRAKGLTPEEEARVLGGEACSWSESVDDVNFDQRALSRTPAVAERLWSAVDIHAEPFRNRKAERAHAENRINRMRCYMLRRGISNAEPLAPDYCPTHPTGAQGATPGWVWVIAGLLAVVCAFSLTSALVLSIINHRLHKQVRTYTRLPTEDA